MQDPLGHGGWGWFAVALREPLPAGSHSRSALPPARPAATFQLWECIRAGTVRQHPLFRVAAADTGSGGASAQLPAVGTGSGYQRYGGEGSV